MKISPDYPDQSVGPLATAGGLLVINALMCANHDISFKRKQKGKRLTGLDTNVDPG